MKILITGGAGFIGSHLADELVSQGNTVYIIDDLSTGRMCNLDKISSSIYFNFGSILDESLMDSLIREVDQIYHLAAVVGVKRVMEEPIKTLEVNVKGTEIVLKLANKYKKKTLIASSSEIYGDNYEFSEDSEDSRRILGSVKKRRWAYACSKTMDEFMALAYFDKENLPVVIARLFNTAGSRQVSDYGMVLPTFIEQALNGVPITIHGDGNQTRSFCHVYDMVQMLIRLMNDPIAEGNIFNAGNDKEITIKDLAEMVKEITRSNSEIVFIPYNDVYGGGFVDMKRRCPEIFKIRTLIGYYCKYDLDIIIQDIIEEKQK